MEDYAQARQRVLSEDVEASGLKACNTVPPEVPTAKL